MMACSFVFAESCFFRSSEILELQSVLVLYFLTVILYCLAFCSIAFCSTLAHFFIVSMVLCTLVISRVVFVFVVLFPDVLRHFVLSRGLSGLHVKLLFLGFINVRFSFLFLLHGIYSFYAH
jgi:hypothetical protein